MIKLDRRFKEITKTDKRFVLITGGRGSMKSFSISTLLCLILDSAKNQVIFFLRYTMSSAEKSIIPEVVQKITLLGIQARFEVVASQIRHIANNSFCTFSGIKTSSGIETAKLKGLSDANVIVVDEAEEWVDEEAFDKANLSIRSNNKKNMIILILNPSNVNHWIYKRWIKDTHKLVNIDGVDIEISTHPNVLHLHFTYLDNPHLPIDYIEELLELKATHFEKYAHVVLGTWARESDKSPIKSAWMKYVLEAEVPSKLVTDLWIDGAYTENTKNDPSGFMFTQFDYSKKVLYVKFAKSDYLEMPEMLKAIDNMIVSQKLTSLSKIFIEPKASGKTLAQLLKAKGKTCLEIKGNLIREGKMARAKLAANFFESGQIKIVEGQWNTGFVNQLTSFPVSAHDEYIDLIGYACERYFMNNKIVNTESF